MSILLEHPLAAYIRCVGRRVVKAGPLRQSRAVHILWGDATCPHSIYMQPAEVMEAVTDLCRPRQGPLSSLVILGADSPRAQQDALLMANYIQKHSALIRQVWVAPIPVGTSVQP